MVMIADQHFIRFAAPLENLLYSKNIPLIHIFDIVTSHLSLLVTAI